MKQRAKHIAVVLASAPILYGIDLLVRSLGDGNGPPAEPLYKVLWAMCWEDIRDPQ